MFRYICEHLNILPSEAIMVGDTPADMIMGQAANLGLTIGNLNNFIYLIVIKDIMASTFCLS